MTPSDRGADSSNENLRPEILLLIDSYMRGLDQTDQLHPSEVKKLIDYWEQQPVVEPKRGDHLEALKHLLDKMLRCLVHATVQGTVFSVLHLSDDVYAILRDGELMTNCSKRDVALGVFWTIVYQEIDKWKV